MRRATVSEGAAAICKASGPATTARSAVSGASVVRPLVPDKRADALSVILSVRRGFASVGCSRPQGVA